MNKKARRIMRKVMWFIIMWIAIGFGVYMYFSATFLAGMLIIRKVIYIVLALIAIRAFAHYVCD